MAESKTTELLLISQNFESTSTIASNPENPKNHPDFTKINSLEDEENEEDEDDNDDDEIYRKKTYESPPPAYDIALEENHLVNNNQSTNNNESPRSQSPDLIVHKSSKAMYKALAKQFGITCKMSDNCRCLDCQSHYFDCDYDQNENEKTDGGLGAGTPMFISEVIHGTACRIL